MYRRENSSARAQFGSTTVALRGSAAVEEKASAAEIGVIEEERLGLSMVVAQAIAEPTAVGAWIGSQRTSTRAKSNGAERQTGG